MDPQLVTAIRCSAAVSWRLPTRNRRWRCQAPTSTPAAPPRRAWPRPPPSGTGPPRRPRRRAWPRSAPPPRQAHQPRAHPGHPVAQLAWSWLARWVSARQRATSSRTMPTCTEAGSSASHPWSSSRTRHCSRCRVGRVAARPGSRSWEGQRSRFWTRVRSATKSSRWHQHHPLPSSQQIGQQPTGQVAAVLHRPSRLRPALAGPGDQLLVVAGRRCSAGGVGQLPADRVGGRHRVAGLVGPRPASPSSRLLLCSTRAGQRTQFSEARPPRSYQAMLVSPGRGDGRHDAWMSATVGDTQRRSQPATTPVVMVSESDHDPKPHTEPGVVGEGLGRVDRLPAARSSSTRRL
jgi:hypothetical protein